MRQFSDKIFVTGIYGSGKTYFCKNIIKGYNYTSFDSLYNYITKNDSIVYKVLNTPGKIILDACPIAFEEPAKSKLNNYCNNNKVTLIIINIDKKPWLQRVNKCRKNDGRTNVERIIKYNEFHDKWLPIILENNFEYIYQYNSWSNTWIN